MIIVDIYSCNVCTNLGITLVSVQHITNKFSLHNTCTNMHKMWIKDIKFQLYIGTLDNIYLLKYIISYSHITCKMLKSFMIHKRDYTKILNCNRIQKL